MDLTVIIPCLNAGNTIAGQLEALRHQRWDKSWEVMVADNGSTDDTRDVVRRFQRDMPNLRLVDVSARRGCAAARNLAIPAARGDCIAFCDADDEVAPGWVVAMGEALRRHDFVACEVDDRRLNPHWVRSLWHAPERVEQGLPVCLDFLPSAAGCGFGLTRQVFEEVGEFDESLPRLDDFDYSWRVQLTGRRVHCVPQAVIHYRHRHTLLGTYRLCFDDGRSEVMLVKKFGDHGLSWRPWRQALRDWVHVPFMLLRVRDRISWGLWLKTAGVLAGRMVGSIEHRTLAL